MIPYLDADYVPHCPSRGFENGRELVGNGSWFKPAALEALLRVDDYEAFNLGLEDGPHIAIPRSIRGDLLATHGTVRCVGFLIVLDIYRES